MKVSDIVKQVREYLDEVDALNAASVLNGSAPVDERIMSIIPEVAVVFGEGISMPITNGMIFEDGTTIMVVPEDGVVKMDIPANFGRLYELKMERWKRSVYDAIAHDTPQYRRQQNLVTRGGVVRPVVAIVPNGEGRRLELYSLPHGDARAGRVERAMYVPVPTIEDGDTEINVSADKVPALCYMIAVRVARSYGNEQAAHLLSSTLNEQMTVTSII